MPGGFNPNAAYTQISTDTGQIIFLQGATYFDINGNVVLYPFFSNGPGSGGQAVPELDCKTGAKVMVNGDTLFTAVGDCQILNLNSECVTNNDGTLTTVQYSITPTLGSATPISGVSASLASLVAGASITLLGGAVTTAPAIYTQGVGIGTAQSGMLFPDGILKLVVATGPTTGTWKHYMRYRPLEAGAYIKANQ